LPYASQPDPYHAQDELNLFRHELERIIMIVAKHQAFAKEITKKTYIIYHLRVLWHHCDYYICRLVSLSLDQMLILQCFPSIFFFILTFALTSVFSLSENL